MTIKLNILDMLEELGMPKSKSKRLIIQGAITVDGRRINNFDKEVDDNSVINIKGKPHPHEKI